MIIAQSKFTFLILTSSFIWSRGLAFLAIAISTIYFNVEALAFYALWISFTSVVSVFVGIRLEQQIPASNKQEAQLLLALSFGCVILSSTLISLGAWCISDKSIWWWFGFSVMLRALQPIFSLWSVRIRKVRQNAGFSAIEAVVRFILTITVCLTGQTQIWIMPLIDGLAMTAYTIACILFLPMPRIMFSFKKYTLYMQVFRKVVLNAMFNAGSVISETILTNMPIFLAGASSSATVVSAIFLVHRMGEVLRNLVGATLSIWLFRKMVVLKMHEKSATAIKNKREKLLTSAFQQSFTLNLCQFSFVYIGLLIAVPYLPYIWSDALDLVPFIAGFYFFLALVAPAFRLYTIDHREAVSFTINTIILAGGALIYTTLVMEYCTFTAGLILLTILSLIRAGIVAFTQRWQ